jgi:hypothetical protein
MGLHNQFQPTSTNNIELKFSNNPQSEHTIPRRTLKQPFGGHLVV